MSKQPAPPGISPREAEILARLGEHRSNAEIAAELFISVRTVETHVSSLLRKLDAPDRRALAGLAARLARPAPAPVTLPAPLSPFVGRAREREALRDAVTAHRQVTAVGPGGVGKTRLVLAVAADLAGAFPDGVWFVDLVPVTDPGMVTAAVAAALGLGEQQGGGFDDAVPAALAGHRALLVLDNCEHLADGVAPFVERLLARCPQVSVLATSRARLMVPFEWVYPVPPLSLDGESDAVALFRNRAAAVGATIEDAQVDQVADLCRKLDGVALAIELAAARLPTLGLDGLVAGLGDHLRLLVGGYRADDRHRSVRAMLDWSQALLSGDDLALLRRVAVFVAPFTAPAAAAVAGFDPLAPGHLADGLARLADQSLLGVTASAGGTRYRVLETIRQYGAEQLAAAGEQDEAPARHLRWCLTAAGELADSGQEGWRARFDAVADDLRAALSWAADRPDRRADAYRLALLLGGLAFDRNLIGESQQRYEQAAALAGDPAPALRHAAAVAACRMRGDDAYRLWRAAADAAGDTAAARDLAAATTTYYRKAGAFTRRPPRAEPMALLARARELAGDDLAAQTAVALADCAAAGYAFFAEQAEEAASRMLTLAGRAVELARRLGDPLAEGAALFALTGAHRRAGDEFAAAATARRRVELLEIAAGRSGGPAGAAPGGGNLTPDIADELIDALFIATVTSIGTGDLVAARSWGRRLRDLPLLAEAGHVATARILMADALAGHATDVLAESGRFLDGWIRAGRPPARHLGPAAAAVAMVHDLRGDRPARDEWLAVLDQLGVTAEDRAGYHPVFEAIALLHHGEPARAGERLAVPGAWRTGILMHWHVALRVEAAVLAGHPKAADLLTETRPLVAGNPIAGALLDRAAALLDDDGKAVLATAAAFEAAGCPYQRQRTLHLAGLV
ncbi:LuxR C-terminal-related transcriptional regulator [Actinoplanes oblitus]|uniref:LuxR C-terminal-related transcriptional regulator n=1 Tax=Actinoplanes oblitus TaxID=3040509 RepID=A0ABY8WPJ6_9ACTN|nr:LuxR C-terminal-related transcriptional regulator [Actinoplanes oblitus]WIM99801.1 LuxR C-terminal-related transcriptional regulator [Actinoplanes oblitus]